VKTWATLRLEEDGTLTAEGYASEEVDAGTGDPHTVTASVPLELPVEVAEDIKRAQGVAADALKRALRRNVGRTLAAVEDHGLGPAPARGEARADGEFRAKKVPQGE
jgi:hypothetical protein